MQSSQSLSSLPIPETGLVLLAALVLGAVGALIHFVASGDPLGADDRWWKTALIGAVAGLGILYVVDVPATTQFVGLMLLSGFFARTLLAALEARLKLVVANQERVRAIGLAREAVGMAQSTQRAARGIATGTAPAASSHLDSVAAQVALLGRGVASLATIHPPLVESADYPAGNASALTVQVVIGNAQAGAWTVRVGANLFQGGSSPIEIGSAADLRGTLVVVIVTATAVSPALRLSEITTMAGGPAPLEVEQHIPPANVSMGDTAVFMTLFKVV